MKRKSKKYSAFASQLDKTKTYSPGEALRLIVDNKTAQFDESVDVSVSLGVDTQQSNQQVRGSAVLPHGLGKPVRVIVFAKGEDEKKARQAGADIVGSEDLVEKIKKGWMEFDTVIASPDQMPLVSKLAPILGPRGLMPNPKMGTVSKEPHLAVSAEKKGKAGFKAVQSGKNGLIHSTIGRRSLGAEKLKENYDAFINSLMKAKPAASKGHYIRKICVSATMGPRLFVLRG